MWINPQSCEKISRLLARPRGRERCLHNLPERVNRYGGALRTSLDIGIDIA
jgi:hypothetical protein